MATTQNKDIPDTQVISQIEQTLNPKEEKFEDISIPLVKAAQEQDRLKRKSDCEAQGGTFTDPGCTFPPPPPKPVYEPVIVYIGTLTGSYGYALPWGNCVDEPGVNNPGWGSPINWPTLFSEPQVGETVLFWYNHTGVITGIWSNGDIEIRHRNYYGGQTRFPRSAFRGFR